MSGYPSRPALTRCTILVAALVAGCAGPAPSVGPASPSPSPSATPEIVSLAGLAVAAGAPLLISDDAGDLAVVEPPTGPVVTVSAGGGTLVVLGDDGEALWRTAEGWSPLELPAPGAGIRLIAVAPDGHRLAVVIGEPARPLFRLHVLGIDGAAAKQVAFSRGLNGPPAWLDADTVVVDAIAANGTSGLVAIDVSTGQLSDEQGPGTILTASSDGAVVALDDPASGAALVGRVAAWREAQPETMTRLAGPAGTAADALALSPDGRRLAVVWRGDSGASLELYGLDPTGWTSVRRTELSGAGPIAIAWTR